MKLPLPVSGPISDRIGIALSTLCVVHCLILPALLLLLPLVALQSLPEWIRESEWVHAALIIPVLLISGPVLARGGISDRRIWFLAILAFALLAAALMIETKAMEQLMTVVGALLLLIAHRINMGLNTLSER